MDRSVSAIQDRPAEAVEDIPQLPWYTRAKFGIVRVFLASWMRCFGLTGLYRFGAFFGTCEWLINYKLRRRYRKRLRFIFGPDHFTRAEARRLTRDWFCRVRCDKLFYLVFDKIPKAKVIERVEFIGQENMDAGLARGKGVYAAMSHVGTQHVAGVLMAILGYKVAGVRDRKEGALRLHMQQIFAQRYPEVAALRILFADRFPRELFRLFKQNYILGTSLDVDRERAPHLSRQKVVFFGEEREWLTGTLQIALRCGAVILPSFWVSLPNYYFQLIAYEPLVDPDTAKDEPETVAMAMQRYAERIEAHARAHPDHLSKV
ncbi:MAG: lysophospholipid acyltransferase family protein [Phycisphaerae bacterium]|nr:lysophospholipid acyltransferase family protein [Phycisphaerae bacterium]